MVVVVVLGARVVVIALLSGVAVLVGGGGLTATGALERTMGRAKADMTMPVVRKYASSLQGLLALSSL